MANKMRKDLLRDDWEITIVDQYKTHYYQPGFLFIPFGMYGEQDVVKPKGDFFPAGVKVVYSEIDRVDGDMNRVLLTNGVSLKYDYLIIATGVKIAPEKTPGLKENLWHQKIFDFYTIEGAVALSRFFKTWQGGHLVINIAELPYKCPVAPLEFAFFADAFFTERGMRDKVKISYVTLLPGAFTKPRASKMLGGLMEEKNIEVVSEFYIQEVDNEKKEIVSYSGDRIPFDCLVSIPTNMGDEMIERSGLAEDLNFIATDKHTLQSKAYDNVFVIGDATDLPTSKAGSVAHFQADILYENFLSIIEGREPKAKFDGHANCFIESGFNKGILIDFNYDTEPLPGKYPLPGVGPFSLLEETKMNHYGKVMFRWMYWNFLVKGLELPIESHMSMAGKRL